MQITKAMADVIKGYETGARMVNGHPVLLPHGQPALTAYQDSKGIWTIGWGHTGRAVGPKSVINLSLAIDLFLTDIAYFEHGVMRLINGGAPTSQGQFDALVSFAYNCGLDEDVDTKAEGLGDSTLLKLHRAGHYTDAAAEFGKWTSGGLAGLVKRRAEETEFYLRHS